jgi:hypothetical protein
VQPHSSHSSTGAAFQTGTEPPSKNREAASISPQTS